MSLQQFQSIISQTDLICKTNSFLSSRLIESIMYKDSIIEINSIRKDGVETLFSLIAICWSATYIVRMLNKLKAY